MVDNLPLELTSFIGREHETAEVARLFAMTRLITLTGTGGVGKTRLALRVAAAIAAKYRDGICCVELAALSDEALVPQAVAAAFGLQDSSWRSPMDDLVDALRPKQALLLFDNCEHLLAACADVASALLRTCPSVHLLATSREPMNIAGETCWRVPPLTMPQSAASISEVLESEAAQLFVDRARAVVPGLEITKRTALGVADICRRLDGLPLAIELAAARMNVLSIDQIAERLNDRFQLLTAGRRSAPTRQQTLQAAIDWSYNMLSAPEQRLFERVSLFAGGWTLEAAEAVGADDGIAKAEVLDLLARLHDKSLILVEHAPDGPVRYRLLETLRQYGQERLVEHGACKALAGRHARYFTELAEKAQADFFGPRETQALDCLKAEHDNLRAALAWLIKVGDVEQAQRLGALVGLFCLFRSYISEGRAWLEQVLAMGGGRWSSTHRAKCLFAAAQLAWGQGDYEAAEVHVKESLSLWRNLGERWRSLGDDHRAAAALYMLGFATRVLGDATAAVPLLQEAARLGHQAGNYAHEVLSLVALADIAASQGNFVGARKNAEKAWALAAEIGWTRGVAHALRALADACFEQQDDTTACRFAEEAVAKVREDVGSPWWLATYLLSLARIATAQQQFAQARSALVEALTLCRELGDKSGLAGVLEGFAYLASAVGELEPAVCLSAVAQAERNRAGSVLSPASPRIRRQLDSAASILPEDVCGAARQRGQLMSLEQAAGYALSGSLGPDATLPFKPAGISDPLTLREREVVSLVAQSMSNFEIARQLVLSERTIESHVRNARSKLGLSSRVALALWAVEHHRGSATLA